MKILCWVKTIVRSFPWIDGWVVEGCDWVDVEHHKNCDITVSRCEICGKTDISWSGGYKLNE